jgi:hypothetical protein
MLQVTNGETSARMSACPFSIMISSWHQWMPRLVLHACCLPMDAASCPASPCALRLLPTYGCSFVPRFALCSAPAARPWIELHALRLLATPMDKALYSMPASLTMRMRGPLHPSRPPSPVSPCRACSWNTCNIKAFAVTYVWNRWNIYNICLKHMYRHCNICNIQIKHLQCMFEIAEVFETYTCNIRV